MEYWHIGNIHFTSNIFLPKNNYEYKSRDEELDTTLKIQYLDLPIIGQRWRVVMIGTYFYLRIPYYIWPKWPVNEARLVGKIG